MQVTALLCRIGLLLAVAMCIACHTDAQTVTQTECQLGTPLDLNSFAGSSTSGNVIHRLSLGSVLSPSNDTQESIDNLGLGFTPESAQLTFCDLTSGALLGDQAVFVPNADLFSRLQASWLENPEGIVKLLAFGEDSIDRLLMLPMEAWVAGNPSVAPATLGICGSTGLHYTDGGVQLARRSCSAPLPQLSIRVSTTTFLVLDWLVADPTLALPTPPSAADPQFDVAMSPGAASCLEVDVNSPWCLRAGSNPVVVRVGQPSLAMPLLIHDVWGNPAATATGGDPVRVTVGIHGVANSTEVQFSLLGSGTSLTIPGGSWCARVPPMTIVAPVTSFRLHSSQQPNRTVTSLGNFASFETTNAYAIDLKSDGLTIGGRTSKCRRVELTPGPVQSLVLDITPSTLPHPGLFFQADKHFMVPDMSQTNINVKAMDSAGNLLAQPIPSCGRHVEQLAWNLTTQVCLNCTVEGIDASEWTTQPVGSQSQYSASLVLPGNRIESGRTYNVTCKAVDRLRRREPVAQSVALHAVPAGEFDCYDGSVSISDVFSETSLGDVQNTFFSKNNEEVPLVQLTILTHITQIYANPERKLDRYLQWVLSPKTGFLAVPLGLLSAMAFGAHYTTVSHVNLNMTKPLCRSFDEFDFRKAVAKYIHEVGMNSSLYYRQQSVGQAPSTQSEVAPLSVCHGNNIEALEFVELQCCDQYGFCRRSTTESPLSILLLVSGVFIGVGVALAAFIYFRSVQTTTPVHILNRREMDMQAKTRVILVHILAPFVLIAHVYFIFDLSNNKAATFLFVMDLSLPVLWVIATIIRVQAPHFEVTNHIYKGTGVMLMMYSVFLLSNAAVWTAASLHLNIRLIPFCASSILVVTQVFFTIRDASAELGPTILGNRGGVTHSMVPIDSVMSLQTYAITAMMFMFAMTWAGSDLSPFGAVIAAFVILAYAALFNYSLAAQFQEAFQKHFGAGDKNVFVKLVKAQNGGDMDSSDEDFDNDEDDDGSPMKSPKRASEGHGRLGEDGDPMRRNLSVAMTDLIGDGKEETFHNDVEDPTTLHADVDYSRMPDPSDSMNNDQPMSRQQSFRSSRRRNNTADPWGLVAQRFIGGGIGSNKRRTVSTPPPGGLMGKISPNAEAPSPKKHSRRQDSDPFGPMMSQSGSLLTPDASTRDTTDSTAISVAPSPPPQRPSPTKASGKQNPSATALSPPRRVQRPTKMMSPSAITGSSTPSSSTHRISPDMDDESKMLLEGFGNAGML